MADKSRRTGTGAGRSEVKLLPEVFLTLDYRSPANGTAGGVEPATFRISGGAVTSHVKTKCNVVVYWLRFLVFSYCTEMKEVDGSNCVEGWGQTAVSQHENWNSTATSLHLSSFIHTSASLDSCFPTVSPKLMLLQNETCCRPGPWMCS